MNREPQTIAPDIEVEMINVGYGIKGIWELSAVMQTIANATLENPQDLPQTFKTLAARLHQDVDALADDWRTLERKATRREEVSE